MQINKLQGLYFASEHDLDKDVFYPILKESSKVDCMTGYFTSGALRELAYSLSYFLKTKNNNLRFIVSPNLISEDIEALIEGIKYEENLIPLLFPSFDLTEETLRKKTLEALSYLVIKKRLIIKIAVQESGLFHTKCWIFHTSQGRIVVHGSINATSSGFSQNFEQLALNKSWENKQSKDIVNKINHTFETIWEGKYKGLKTIEINKKTLIYLEKKSKENFPDNSRLLASELIKKLKNISEKVEPHTLSIPSWLNYTSGDFSHQGEAIKAWISNDGKGIMSIATGGGKTLTSLVAASLIAAKEKGLFLVIAVPTVALVEQWVTEVELFGVSPLNTQTLQSSRFGAEISKRIRNLRSEISNVEILVVTHNAVKSKRFNRLLDKATNHCTLMLIGDEVHNLGSLGFQEEASNHYKYRLGLSATFERQFDVDGTSFLLNYFGKVVYKYDLSDAIGTCLVPFKYHVHKILLTDKEEEEWLELTQEIKKLSYTADLPDNSNEKERWKILCLKRRRIVESASGKISIFANILPKNRHKVKRTLVFCTDKYPKQLNLVNDHLTRRRINFHQVTSEETSNKNKLQKIVRAFHSDELQVLTSKRVLDEGFNIPQTETAFLLANNTVTRQWVQRLGRVLRKSKDTGKKNAIIHDFLVLPLTVNSNVDPDLLSLIRGEYKRISFFNSLSSNGLEKNGSYEVIEELLNFIKGVKNEHRV